jgi:hypothetical protein
VLVRAVSVGFSSFSLRRSVLTAPVQAETRDLSRDRGRNEIVDAFPTSNARSNLRRRDVHRLHLELENPAGGVQPLAYPSNLGA